VKRSNKGDQVLAFPRQKKRVLSSTKKETKGAPQAASQSEKFMLEIIHVEAGAKAKEPGKPESRKSPKLQIEQDQSPLASAPGTPIGLNCGVFDLTWETGPGQSVKREREEDEGGAIPKIPKQSLKFKLKDLLNELNEKVRDLQKITGIEYPTNVELAEKVATILSLVSNIKTDDFTRRADKGNPLQSAKQSDFALTVPEDDRKMERGIARLFADMFPELRELELEENDWETHRVPHIIQSTAVPRKAGGNLIKERYIFRQVLENKEGETANEKAYRHLRALVREAERLGRRQLAVVRLEGTNELLQQKMLECLTAHSGLQIELCVPSYASRLGGKEAPSSAGTTNEGEQWRYPQPRRPRTETLVVKAKEDNADMEEVIRQMKSKVDIAKVDVQVKSLVGGRNGKIAIKLAPARGTAAPNLRKAILEAMGNTVNAEAVSNRKLTVRDLDQAITEDVIREAVNAAVGSPDRSTEAIQVSGLKKPRGGMAGMATLHLSDTDADKQTEGRSALDGTNVACRKSWDR
jgi:hypothetical protein